MGTRVLPYNFKSYVAQPQLLRSSFPRAARSPPSTTEPPRVARRWPPEAMEDLPSPSPADSRHPPPTSPADSCRPPPTSPADSAASAPLPRRNQPIPAAAARCWSPIPPPRRCMQRRHGQRCCLSTAEASRSTAARGCMARELARRSPAARAAVSMGSSRKSPRWRAGRRTPCLRKSNFGLLGHAILRQPENQHTFLCPKNF